MVLAMNTHLKRMLSLIVGWVVLIGTILSIAALFGLGSP
jgi:hypothetical protein